jgi:hypothetical protein
MKNVTVDFMKGGSRAECVLRYEHEDGLPREQEWSGDVDEFRLDDGSSMDLNCPLHWLEDVVEFQAAQAGAEFVIKEDGGEVSKDGEGKLIFTGMVVDTYIATFKKGDRQASCDLCYWGGAGQPMRTEWTGDEEAYRLPDGSLFKFRYPQETLERELASQAEQIGAEFTITHRSVTLE